MPGTRADCRSRRQDVCAGDYRARRLHLRGHQGRRRRPGYHHRKRGPRARAAAGGRRRHPLSGGRRRGHDHPAGHEAPRRRSGNQPRAAADDRAGGSAGFPNARGRGDGQHPRRRGAGEKDVQSPAGRGRRAVRAGHDGRGAPDERGSAERNDSIGAFHPQKSGRGCNRAGFRQSGRDGGGRAFSRLADGADEQLRRLCAGQRGRAGLFACDSAGAAGQAGQGFRRQHADAQPIRRRAAGNADGASGADGCADEPAGACA